MNGILWGLLGAAFIGVSDCIARVTAQRVSLSVLFLWVMTGSFVIMTGYYLAMGNWPEWSPWGWGASAISGLLNLVVLGLLYKALARGPVTIASPAAGTFSIMLILLNILSGEAFTNLQLVASFIVFLGIVMISQKSKTAKTDEQYDSKWLLKTAYLGLAAAFTVSVRMFLAQEAGSDLGAIDALYLNRVFALLGAICLISFFLIRHAALTWPKGKIVKLVLLQSLLEMLALGAFLHGSQGDGRIGATIGFSAFSILTAVTAWVWLKEPIGTRRLFWMFVIIAALGLASYANP